MHRIIRLLTSIFVVLPIAAMAQDVIVTRNFTGLWDQSLHESQGLNLQIIQQAGGEKLGIAYWFTYSDDLESAWFLGVGPVNGDRIEMILYEASGVGFLESNQPGNDRVREVGVMEIEFSSCNEGTVTFETGMAEVGSGTFPIERLTDLFNSECSGGVSDDTPQNVLISEQRIELQPARDGITGSGHADFQERADRTEFSVEVEDLADGEYRILVDGIDRGGLAVSLGRGETEFRSPVETGKVLLTFDPRGSTIEVHDGQGAVLSSGEGSLTRGQTDDGGDDNGGNVGGDIDFGIMEIEVPLTNTGVYPAASGNARLRPRPDRTDFSVEIEDVPAGTYSLRIGDIVVGSIQALIQVNGDVVGEVEFRNPVEPGKTLLDFDPRGKPIEVLQDATVILQTLFPTG